GIMRGNDNYFRPGDNLTRAEMATVVMRCVELIAANETNRDQELQVPVGSILYLNLASNPTTGHTWTIVGGADGVIRSTGSAYLLDNNTDSLPAAGQGGRHFWRFQ